MGNIVDHPAAALMAEVKAEHAVAEAPEAQALQEAIFSAVRAYYDYLDRHGVRYELTANINQAISEADVIYQTRIRPDRAADAAREQYTINSSVLQRIKSNAMILHPLPRTVELDKTVDQDPRALYFRQAENGLYVRMALLTMLLENNLK